MFHFYFPGEGGEGEAPPEGTGDEATPSDDEEGDGGESVVSSISQPLSPQSTPHETDTELVLRCVLLPRR